MPFSIKRNKNIAESSIHVSMASRHKKGPVVSGLFLPSAYARRPASIGHVLSIQQYLPLTTLISIQSHLIACFWHVLALFARNKNTAESSPGRLTERTSIPPRLQPASPAGVTSNRLLWSDTRSRIPVFRPLPLSRGAPTKKAR